MEMCESYFFIGPKLLSKVPNYQIFEGNGMANNVISARGSSLI
jgi:hypothetical protein